MELYIYKMIKYATYKNKQGNFGSLLGIWDTFLPLIGFCGHFARFCQ